MSTSKSVTGRAGVEHLSQSYPRLLKWLVFIVLFAGVTPGARVFAAPRPASIPSDFVITPFGYFHPSCVNHLAEGDVLQKEEKAIQRASGAYENVPACAYPHYRADGEQVTGDERSVHKPTISHSWMVSASSTTSSAYGSIYAEWTPWLPRHRSFLRALLRRAPPGYRLPPLASPPVASRSTCVAPSDRPAGRRIDSGFEETPSSNQSKTVRPTLYTQIS